MINLKNKEIQQIISNQKTLILKIYELEFEKSRKFYILNYFVSKFEVLSSVVFCIGLTVFILINVRENPIIEHVDAEALIQDTASRISTNMTKTDEKIVENIDVIDDSIKKIEYAIAYAKKNKIKELRSASKVEYISTLETLKQKLYSLKNQKISELKISLDQNPIPLHPVQYNISNEQDIKVLLSSLAN